MLTRHGRHLAEEGTRLLDDLEELQSGLHRQASTVGGHVRLVAFASAVRGLVAPAVPPVLHAHPGLRVSIAERAISPRSSSAGTILWPAVPWSRPPILSAKTG
jgi:DNA-binding transcriptional LysR family regulator